MNHAALKQLSKAFSVALVKTCEAVKTDVISKNVMPFRVGTMQNESVFVDDSQATRGIAVITVDTPYARRLYFHPEYKFNKAENPDAQGRWFDPWIDGVYAAMAQNALNTFYKKEAGL